ncbi:MAG: hypothetical protein VX000_15550 [Myxococcota bacterium]|nr:hypothetical protein [Myxococcota bacterium]
MSSAYGAVAAPSVLHRMEQVMIRVSLLGLSLHLLLVWLGRAGWLPANVADAVGTSFLGALYTPFSFVLFYEVLLLVLALPASMTISLGKQFEIVSLVLLRSVFKDVADFEALASVGNQQETLTAILWDMGGGAAMFALLAGFYHVSRRSPRRAAVRPLTTMRPRVAHFVAHKRALALLLAVLLCLLAAGHLAGWLLDTYHVVHLGQVSTLDVDRIFYEDLFTVMVFVDVVVLLLSMELDSAYPMVFRNAGYVVSTILLRFSLSLGKPWNVTLAVLAVLFGILVAATFRYWRWLDRSRDAPAPGGVDGATDPVPGPPAR